MRVYDDAFRLAIGDAEDDVGCFSSDAIKLDEFIEGVWHCAGVFLDEALGAIANGAGLVTKKPCTVNHAFQFRGRSGGKIFGITILAEKSGGNEIYARVSTLCTQNGRDKKLERILVNQGAAHVRVGGPESAENRPAAGQQFALGKAHASQYSISIVRTQFYRRYFNE